MNRHHNINLFNTKPDYDLLGYCSDKNRPVRICHFKFEQDFHTVSLKLENLSNLKYLPKKNLKVVVTERSLHFTLEEYELSNVHFIIQRLAHRIVPSETQIIVTDNNTIVIRMLKAKPFLWKSVIFVTNFVKNLWNEYVREFLETYLFGRCHEEEIEDIWIRMEGLYTDDMNFYLNPPLPIGPLRFLETARTVDDVIERVKGYIFSKRGDKKVDSALPYFLGATILYKLHMQCERDQILRTTKIHPYTTIRGDSFQSQNNLAKDYYYSCNRKDSRQHQRGDGKFSYGNTSYQKKKEPVVESPRSLFSIPNEVNCFPATSAHQKLTSHYGNKYHTSYSENYAQSHWQKPEKETSYGRQYKRGNWKTNFVSKGKQKEELVEGANESPLLISKCMEPINDSHAITSTVASGKQTSIAESSPAENNLPNLCEGVNNENIFIEQNDDLKTSIVIEIGQMKDPVVEATESLSSITRKSELSSTALETCQIPTSLFKDSCAESSSNNNCLRDDGYQTDNLKTCIIKKGTPKKDSAVKSVQNSSITAKTGPISAACQMLTPPISENCLKENSSVNNSERGNNETNDGKQNERENLKFGSISQKNYEEKFSEKQNNKTSSSVTKKGVRKSNSKTFHEKQPQRENWRASTVNSDNKENFRESCMENKNSKSNSKIDTKNTIRERFRNGGQEVNKREQMYRSSSRCPSENYMNVSHSRNKKKHNEKQFSFRKNISNKMMKMEGSHCPTMNQSRIKESNSQKVVDEVISSTENPVCKLETNSAYQIRDRCGEPPPSVSAEELKNKGNDLFRAQNYHKAINCYTAALNVDPECPNYYTNRAACHMKLENYKECFADAYKAYNLDKSSSKAHYYMGKSSLHFGSISMGVSYLDTALKLNPSHIGDVQKEIEIGDRLIETLGHYLRDMQAGNIMKSLKHLKELDRFCKIGVDDLQENIYKDFLEAGFSINVKDLATAELSANPVDYKAMYFLAKSNFYLDLKSEALASIDLDFTSDPGVGGYYKLIKDLRKDISDFYYFKENGDKAFENEDFSEAEKWYELAVDVDSLNKCQNAILYCKLGDIKLEDANYEEAYKFFDLSLSKDEDYIIPRWRKIECMYTAHFEIGGSHLRKKCAALGELATNSTDTQTLYYLARCNFYLDLKKEALRILKLGFSMAGDDDIYSVYMFELENNMEDFYNLKEMGEEAFENQNYIEVQQCYMEAVEVDSLNKHQNASLYYKMGNIKFEGKFYEQALKYYALSIKSNPDYLDVRYKKIDCYTLLEQQDKLDKELEDLSKWKKEGTHNNHFKFLMELGESISSNTDIMQREGEIHQVAGRFELAVQCYTAALLNDQDSADLFIKRSQCFLSMDNYSSAYMDAKSAGAIEPSYAASCLQMGKCCLVSGMYFEAFAMLDLASEIDPSNRDVTTELEKCKRFGNLMVESINVIEDKNYEAGAYALGEVVKIARGAFALYLDRAECLILIGRFKEVQCIADFLNESDSNKQNYYCLLSMQNYYHGDLDEAALHLKKAVEDSADHEKSVKLLSKLERISKIKNEANNAFVKQNFETSLSLYKTGLKIDPLNKFMTSFFHYSIGLSQSKLKNIPSAIEAFSLAISSRENYLEAYLKRAECYLESGKRDFAIRDYRTMCKLSPCEEYRKLLEGALNFVKR